MSINRLTNLSKFPDCSALSEMGKCTRLTVFNCQGEKCSFRQTSEEEYASIQYVYNRLSSLDSSIQGHIAKKYYGGSMPWKEKDPATIYRGYKRPRFGTRPNKDIRLTINEK